MKPNGALRPTLRGSVGDYRLAIDTGIEDLAGNHIGEAFDIDIFEKVSKTIGRESAAIRFTIR